MAGECKPSHLRMAQNWDIFTRFVAALSCCRVPFVATEAVALESNDKEAVGADEAILFVVDSTAERAPLGLVVMLFE